MPIIESQVDRNGDEFKKNRERMLAAIQEFRDAEASVHAASEKSRARFAKRKQLLPRERIAPAARSRRAVARADRPLCRLSSMHDDTDGSSAGRRQPDRRHRLCRAGTRCHRHGLELGHQGRHDDRALRSCRGRTALQQIALETTSCR
jgi:hypothetical protein